MESTHVRPLAPNPSLSSLERAVPLVGGKFQWSIVSDCAAPAGSERHCRERRGPQRAAAWETEARPMPLFAWAVNTEGPRP
jgi:hypothetical protein